MREKKVLTEKIVIIDKEKWKKKIDFLVIAFTGTYNLNTILRIAGVNQENDVINVL